MPDPLEVIPRTGYIGGAAGALDAYPSATLQTGNIAHVSNATVFSVHYYNAASAVAESSPDVIRPDDIAVENPGRWLLIKAFIFADGTIPLTGDWDIGVGRHIKAEKIMARSEDGLLLVDETGDGIDIVDGGIVSVAMQSGCRVYMNGDQTILANVSEIAEFDVEDWDVQTEFNTGTYTFTAREAGKYWVFFQASFNVTADQDRLVVYIYKNAGIEKRCRLPASGVTPQTPNVSAILDLSANDTISFYIVNLDNNDTINSLKDRTYAVIQKLA